MIAARISDILPTVVTFLLTKAKAVGELSPADDDAIGEMQPTDEEIAAKFHLSLKHVHVVHERARKGVAIVYRERARHWIAVLEQTMHEKHTFT